MNQWANTVLTEKGIALLTKLTQGNTLTITKAVVGSGFVTPGTLMGRTEVAEPQQELTFRPTTYPEEGKCKLTVVLSNDGLAAGYDAMQVGLFATDPDEGEVLFAIAQTQDEQSGTIVPSATEMPGFSAEWSFYFKYGQADGVNLAVDPTNTVTRKEMEDYVAEAGGKRMARLTIGTSTSGWKVAECDYLCDGTDDQEEINAAIAALPTNGGEIVLLDGTYKIGSAINITKRNTTLRGNGNNTILERTFNGNAASSDKLYGLVNIAATYCTVRDLAINGTVTYNGTGIVISQMAAVVENVRIYNCKYNGITAEADYCKITRNHVDSCQNGIEVTNANGIVEGNHCIMNTSAGIFIRGALCVASGNVCEANYMGIAVSGTNDNITGNICMDNTRCDFYVGGTGNIVDANTANNADTTVPGIEFLSSAKNAIIGYNRIANGVITVKGTDIEWADPPMEPGVEYRTTERWNGKPVYRKYVSYTGTINGDTSSGTYQVSIPNDITNFGELISCNGFIESGSASTRYPMPYLSLSGGLTAVVGTSSSSIIVRTSSSWDERTWRFDMRYTKK